MSFVSQLIQYVDSELSTMCFVMVGFLHFIPWHHLILLQLPCF